MNTFLLFSIAHAAPRVVGGAPAPADQWPDVAAVAQDAVVNCTGTLIAPQWVLTAEHCLPSNRVILGTPDFVDGGLERSVDATFAHPDPVVTYDVGLLHLAEPVSIPPRDMMYGCRSAFYVDGQIASVAGYGAIDVSAETFGSVLYSAVLPIRQAGCTSAESGCNPLVMPTGELIAGGDGIDSCDGDSGGPLTITIEGQEWLAGVVSRSTRLVDEPCGGGGIYVRTDAIIDWIREVTELPFEEPDCSGMNRPPSLQSQTVRVEQGGRVSLPSIVDPDAGDVHQVEIVRGPVRGGFDGLFFEPEPFQLGLDSVTIRITDNGTPPRAANVTVAVEVVPAGTAGTGTEGIANGCAQGGRTGSAWWILGILPLARYRRSV